MSNGGGADNDSTPRSIRPFKNKPVMSKCNLNQEEVVGVARQHTRCLVTPSSVKQRHKATCVRHDALETTIFGAVTRQTLTQNLAI